MNYINLSGIELYVFLVLVCFLVLSCLIAFVSYFISRKRCDDLKDQLHEEQIRCTTLSRENFRFRLKYGELDVGEKRNV